MIIFEKTHLRNNLDNIMSCKGDKSNKSDKLQTSCCASNAAAVEAVEQLEESCCAGGACAGAESTNKPTIVEAADDACCSGGACSGEATPIEDSCCSAEAPTSCCPSTSAVAIDALAKSEVVKDGTRTAIRIMQMDCPTEEAMIRRLFNNMPEVKQLEFNLIQRVLTVTHTPDSLDKILKAIRSLGFVPEVHQDGEIMGQLEVEHRPWAPLIIAAIIAVAAEVFDFMGMPAWLTIVLAVSAIAIGGLHTYKKGWTALRTGNLNINALMSIAVTGALLIGQWPEAAMVMVLFSLAEVIEGRSLDRARQAISGLMKLAPDHATVLQKDGSWQEIPAREVGLGCVVRIGPGQQIPLDGEIISGFSSVNQAPITGESLPVDKVIGDSVYAGTINLNGSFEYKVTAISENTTLARIIHSVEQAQNAKAPTQRFIDRFAGIYTPIVLGLAVLIAILPPLLLGGEWLDWIYKSLVMLVIACPCALVISTPVSIVSGLATAARQGILIKGGVYLENSRLLKRLIFDKTGTITQGKPSLSEQIIFDEERRQEIHQIAATLAARSDHPISRALVTALDRKIDDSTVTSFEALPGRGTKAVINGTAYYLGSHRLIHELGVCNEALEAQLAQFEQQGKNITLLCNETEALALFVMADQIKDSSRQALEDLHQMGIKTMMLSGDNQLAVNFIAAKVGIDEAYGELLPEDKLERIHTLADQDMVGMVGDGINDAPSLARADIGFAMGVIGSDVALETADVALMDDDLRKIPALIRLSHATHRILIQNISFALGIKAVFLVLTLIGMGAMWMAVFADMGASLIVVLNGLRLLREPA
jgi:Cd2+/Zn2+-exporting ATPase